LISSETTAHQLGEGVARRGGLHRRNEVSTMEVRSDRTRSPHGNAMMRHSPLRHAGALLWKRRPLHLTFFVTRRCDARCDFCFSRGRAAATAGPELSSAEIARLAPSVGPLLWLSYSGGEPTLREDLPEITGIFARHCRPVIVLLSTNGLEPRRTAAAAAGLLAAAPRSTIVVKLSLDGPPELHDRLRGVPGAHGRVLESLGLLRDLAAREPRLEVGINTVLSAANQEIAGEVFAEVSRLDGVNTHTLSLVRGTIPDPALGAVDPARYLAAAEGLARALREGSSRGTGSLGRGSRRRRTCSSVASSPKRCDAGGASSPAMPGGSTSCSTSAANCIPARSSRCDWATCATTLSTCGPRRARRRPGPSSPRSNAASAGARTSAT